MIYTKTGDNGSTSLANGQRVSKDNPRVEAYGTIDELNSHIGLLRTMVVADKHTAEYDDMLNDIQHHLFVIQSLLANPEQQQRQRLPQITPDDIANIERLIDHIDSALPQAKGFVVAGGCMAAAQSNVARCVCRRAERRIITLSEQEKTEPEITVYINRLSDFLFVLSRRINQLCGIAENLYTIR